MHSAILITFDEITQFQHMRRGPVLFNVCFASMHQGTGEDEETRERGHVRTSSSDGLD